MSKTFACSISLSRFARYSFPSFEATNFSDQASLSSISHSSNFAGNSGNGQTTCSLSVAFNWSNGTVNVRPSQDFRLVLGYSIFPRTTASSAEIKAGLKNIMTKIANTPVRHLCDQPRVFERHNCITNHQKYCRKTGKAKISTKNAFPSGYLSAP